MTSSPAMSAAARGRETPDARAFLGKEGGINPSLALHSSCPGEPQRAWPQAESSAGVPELEEARTDTSPGFSPAQKSHRDPPHCRIPAWLGLPTSTGSRGFPTAATRPGAARTTSRICPSVPGSGLTGASGSPEQQWQSVHAPSAPRPKQSPAAQGPAGLAPCPSAARGLAAGERGGHTPSRRPPSPGPRGPSRLTVALCHEHHGGRAFPRPRWPCPGCRRLCRAGRAHLQPRCFPR